jgi:hypothetical protein
MRRLLPAVSCCIKLYAFVAELRLTPFPSNKHNLWRIIIWQCRFVITFLQTSGVPRNFFSGGFNKFSWGKRAERTGIWGRQHPSQGFRSVCKWVKPVFLLGCCYGCIFHGTGNSARLCQNFGISGWGCLTPPPRYATSSNCMRPGRWLLDCRTMFYDAMWVCYVLPTHECNLLSSCLVL